MNVTDGTETVIEPPETDGRVWYPFTVSWSTGRHDAAVRGLGLSDGASGSDGVIAVPLTCQATRRAHRLDRPRTTYYEPPMGPDPDVGPATGVMPGDDGAYSSAPWAN